MKNTNSRPRRTNKLLNILRLALSIGETNSAYNQFSLPLYDKQNITICTFFRSNIMVPKEIILFEGNDTLKGFFRALSAALAYKEHDIVHMHGPQVGFLFLVAMLARPRKSTPATVYTMHTSFPNYKLRHRLLSVPVFVFFKRIVCCGQASFESVPSLYRYLAGDRLCAIPNGVNIGRIDHTVGNKCKRLDNDHFTIVTVGRLIGVKNPLSVLRAFQQSADPTSRLVFIGEGELYEALLKEIKVLGLERQVELRGLIPRDEVYKTLARADLFVSASRIEGLPVSLLEAMACRCPVILSDIAPHREIADDVDFIPLIQADDVAGLTQEIKRYRQMPYSQRADIGERCRELVERRFSLTSMHQTYEELYGQVLNSL
jgi:glycosyltransferase involved in cell wall biosynthesis